MTRPAGASPPVAGSPGPRTVPSAQVLPDLALPDLAFPDLAFPDLAFPDLAMADLAFPVGGGVR